MLRKNFLQFLRFGIVGTIGAVVDFGSYGVMTRLLGWSTVACVSFSSHSFRTDLPHLSSCTTPNYPVVIANLVSVFLALISNFILNKFWTFRERTGNIAAQGAGYLMMGIIGWFLNQFLTALFVSRIEILHTFFGSSVDVAAKVLAIFIVLFFNYGGSKFVIFRRSVPQPSGDAL